MVLNLSVDFNLSFSRISLMIIEHTICIYVLIYVNVFRDLTWFGFLPDFEHNWTYMLFLSHTNVTSVLWEPLKDFFLSQVNVMCSLSYHPAVSQNLGACKWMIVSEKVILTRSLDSEKKLCCVCGKVKTFSWILASVRYKYRPGECWRAGVSSIKPRLNGHDS